MPFFKNISNLVSNFLNSRNIKNSTNIKTGTSNVSTQNTRLTQGNVSTQNTSSRTKQNRRQNNKSDREHYENIPLFNNVNNADNVDNINRNFFIRSWRKFTGQTGQENQGLNSGQEQTFKEGMQFLGAKDKQEQRLRTQAGRIGIRQGIIVAGIGGAWAANALRKDIQNPDELINRLEQPVIYGNGYTQQYPSSYRDRLINILNNTTL